MPSFKPKANKKIKISKKNSVTLDGKHKEIINEFSKDSNNKIPFLKEEKQELLDKLQENEQNIKDILDTGMELEDIHYTDDYEPRIMKIEEIMDIKDRIKEITTEIKSLKQKKKDYFLDNSKLIFDYFENKKNISKNNENNTSSGGAKTKMLNAFFKLNNDDEKKQIDLKNQSIVQKYLTNVDETFIDMNAYINATDVCMFCYKGELIPLEDEGILLCNLCARSVPYLIENEKPSYKEPPKEVCFYAYKRINHFKEIIAQFQGKETTQIPPEVIENIKQQIKKERIDLSQITNQKTKEILKKLGYNKYYEHIPFIKDKLGIKPPIMSPELEETLFNLFIELQGPYSKFCPDNRVNFLNYYYTAYKLCELLGESHYLSHFPMLKDREKRIDQDTIWKQICEELDWEFIPTI